MYTFYKKRCAIGALVDKLIISLQLLGAWARDGLTDEQIAKNMGICRDTLIQWKKRFPDISDTLKRNYSHTEKPHKNPHSKYLKERDAMFSYCEADSPELKEIKRKYDRAVCRVKCLEANITRIDYREFDALMDELEKAQEDVHTLSIAVTKLERVENPAIII